MKKKLALTSIFSLGIALGYFSFISWLLGFGIAKFLGGKRDGEVGKIKSIIIPVGKYKIHLHHWLISLWAGILGGIKGFYLLSPEFFFGFLGGLIFQGIYCYGDWYQIIKRSPL